MKLTNSKCQCAACGRYFNSTSSFDKHRRWSGLRRICVEPTSVGLVDRGGYFGGPPMTEEQKAARGF